MKTHLLITFILAVWCCPPLLRAEGEKPFELTTLLGETYHRCHLIKATPAALTVSHESGVSKVPFQILSDTWREKFHYDEEKAREFEKEEADKRQVAEARRQKLIKERDKELNTQMKQLSATEKKQAEEEAQRIANRTPALAPFPGDPVNQVVTRTEIVVPPVSVLGTPYTPNYTNRSQTYVLPYDASGGGYYVYPNGGTVIVPQGNPYCPTVPSQSGLYHQGSGLMGQRSFGGTIIRIGP